MSNSIKTKDNMKSSFNAFGSAESNFGQTHQPVWLGTVSPRPVGGVLAAAFRKKGIRIPAGTGINLASGVITPMLTYEVKAVAGSVTGITIDPKEYGYVPAVGDYLGLVNASAFGSNGSPVAITAVAPNATDASLLDITIALTGATVGAIVCLGFSSTKVPAPNAYLYNDIYMGDIEVTAAGVTANTVAATGAAVDFHGDGILIDLTPCAGIAAAMKAAVPNVIQVVA